MPYRISELDDIRRRRMPGNAGFIGLPARGGVKLPLRNQPVAPGLDLNQPPGYAGYEQPPASSVVTEPVTGPAKPVGIQPADGARKDEPVTFGERLAAALQGASAAINTPGVTAAGPGDARAGIIRGLAGLGTLSARAAGRRAEREEQKQGLSDKLALALATRETPAQAAAKAGAVAKAQQPYKLELQTASGDVRERVAKAARDYTKDLTPAQAIELNNKVLRLMNEQFRRNFNFTPTDDEIAEAFTDIKNKMLSGTTVVNRVPGL